MLGWCFLLSVVGCCNFVLCYLKMYFLRDSSDGADLRYLFNVYKCIASAELIFLAKSELSWCSNSLQYTRCAVNIFNEGRAAKRVVFTRRASINLY
jgi:hypothetical protein